MRRKDRQTSREQALQIIDSAVYGVLATVNPDGTPYSVPMSFAREGDVLYIHCATEGQKLTNIRENNNVCVCFVSSAENMPVEFSTWYESATVVGKAAEIDDPAEKTRALRLIVERHVPKGMDNFDDAIKSALSKTAALRIEMLEVTGKAQPKP